MPKLRRVPKFNQLRQNQNQNIKNDSSNSSKRLKSKSQLKAKSNQLISPTSSVSSSSSRSSQSFQNSFSTFNQFHSFHLNSNRHHLNIINLPNELIFLIAQSLSPSIISPENWDQPADDLFNFSLACRHLYQISYPLLYRQVAIRINPSTNSLKKATSRIKKLAKQEANRHHPQIKKIYIQDHADDLNSISQERKNWYLALNQSLSNQFKSIQAFCYSRSIDQVIQQSPYKFLKIDQNFLITCSKLYQLEMVYLSGLAFNQNRLNWNGVMPISLQSINLIAIHDNLLEIIKNSHQIKNLKIWRNFLVHYPTIDNWISLDHWSNLESLSLKGFSGNQVIQLQSSLIQSRKMATINHFPSKLHTLDLDEPYNLSNLMRLLEAFKSSILKTLKIIVWRDPHFSPKWIENLAEMFPNLQELQIILETPPRRWWPYKVHAWANALSLFINLKRLTWNYNPHRSFVQISFPPGIKAQVLQLAQIIPSLERVSYPDITGSLVIERRPQKQTAIRSIRWTSLDSSSLLCPSDLEFDDDQDDQSASNQNDQSNSPSTLDQFKPTPSNSKNLADPFSAQLPSSSSKSIHNSIIKFHHHSHNKYLLKLNSKHTVSYIPFG